MGRGPHLLLRGALHVHPPGEEQQEDATRQLEPVITSYSIHYTKLYDQSLREFMPFAGSLPFREAVTHLMDGLDAAFVQRITTDAHREFLVDARRKMTMSVEMFLGIRGKLTYDQLYTLAKSHLP